MQTFSMNITVALFIILGSAVVQCREGFEDMLYNPIVQRKYAKFDIEIQKMLENLTNSYRNLGSAVRRYVQDFHDTFDAMHTFREDQSTTVKVETVVKYPTAIYRLLWRLANLFPEVVLELTRTSDLTKMPDLTHLLFAAPTVTVADVEEYVANVFYLQLMNFFNTSQVIGGEFSGYNTGVLLNLEQILQFAIVGALDGPHVATLEYMEAATEKAKSEEFPVDQRILQSLMELLYRRHDWSLEHNLVDTFVSFDRKLLPIVHRSDFASLRNKFVHAKNSPIGHLVSEMALCQNGLYDSQKVLRQRLVCWQDPTPHPYWTLQPLKVELTCEDPYIYQIHDFFKEGTINLLKELLSPELDRSTVLAEDEQFQQAHYRTSVEALINELLMSLTIVSKLNNQTGGRFNVNENRSSSTPGSGEALQVAAYAPGGAFFAHPDESRPHQPDGGRLLTLMVYLEEPDVGGSTAFPNLGIAVKPVKGSAVMWYNLKGNDTFDKRLIHAGCPVIIGNKWIATKWVHRLDQFVVLPCPLDPKLSFPFPYRKPKFSI